MLPNKIKFSKNTLKKCGQEVTFFQHHSLIFWQWGFPVPWCHCRCLPTGSDHWCHWRSQPAPGRCSGRCGWPLSCGCPTATMQTNASKRKHNQKIVAQNDGTSGLNLKTSAWKELDKMICIFYANYLKAGNLTFTVPSSLPVQISWGPRRAG